MLSASPLLCNIFWCFLTDSQANGYVLSVFRLYSDVVADIRHAFIVHACSWFFSLLLFICTILYVILPTGILNCSYLRRMSLQYGELRPSAWDLLASLGHPNKFYRVSRLDSVTARHSSSGRQPNFAMLNRGRHRYSVGRPSRWALAHILVYQVLVIINLSTKSTL